MDIRIYLVFGVYIYIYLGHPVYIYIYRVSQVSRYILIFLNSKKKWNEKF